MTGKTNFKKIISKFSRANILVVGDLILDEYIWGSVERISPEAPVPVVLANKKSFMPGGAANVANNIKTLGGKAILIGVVGQDKNKDILFSEFKKRDLDTRGIFVDGSRPTTVKTRIIASHQQIVRVDWENADSISQSLCAKIADFINRNLKKIDAIVIEDYGKGVIHSSLLKQIVPKARTKNKIVTVDPKEEHFELYFGATAITPNRKETENAIRNIKIKNATQTLNINVDKLTTNSHIDLAGKELLKFLNLEAVLITLGEHGMRLFEKNRPPFHIDTVAQEVFDVSGAGDTVIATFTLALACGASMKEAAQVANFAAGIVVGKFGVAATTQKELLRRIYQ